MIMPFIEANWMLILVMVLSGAMLVWPYIQRLSSPQKDVGNLQATRLINSENAVLLDIREPAEFEGGRMPNAIHIPLGQLKDRGGELAKLLARPVIVYCERGTRTRGAVAQLAKLGFKDVYSLAGGFKAWKDAGLPVEK
jgi:rhodanese-related sulfurtransferase